MEYREEKMRKTNESIPGSTDVADRADAIGKTDASTPESRLKTLEQRAAVIQKFTLFSNAFISVALNDKETCQYVLRILTGNPRLCLKGVKTQYTILKMASHDAWLDVLAEDETGALYGLEIQRRDDTDHPRRVRFYEAMIDSDVLEKGRTYEELPEVSMIYICQKDFFKSGSTSRRVRKIWDGTLEGYEDGLHTCYVNAEVDDKSEIAELMKYFVTADPEDMSHGALSKRVHYLKCEKAGWEEMCEVTDIFWQDGYAQGEYYGRLKGEQNSELRERRGERRGEKRGRRQGRQQGRQQGRRQAERRFQRLIMAMTAAGEAKDLSRLGEDHAFLTEMYQKYHI